MLGKQSISRSSFAMISAPRWQNRGQLASTDPSKNPQGTNMSDLSAHFGCRVQGFSSLPNPVGHISEGFDRRQREAIGAYQSITTEPDQIVRVNLREASAADTARARQDVIPESL